MLLAEVKVRATRQQISHVARKYSNPVLKAIASGHRVIDLAATIGLVGLNKQHLPKIGICDSGGEAFYSYDEDEHGRYCHAFAPCQDADQEDHIFLPENTLKRYSIQGESWYKAVCPPIPAEIRKQIKPNDRIAFEVKEWDNAGQQPQLGDPVVLRHLQGGKYAVVAEWDLTTLEKKIFGKIL